MPLKYIKTKVSKKVTLDNALHLAISATAIAQELANMSQFPPVSALVNIIMLIFQTVQVCALLNHSRAMFRYAPIIHRMSKRTKRDVID